MLHYCCFNFPWSFDHYLGSKFNSGGFRFKELSWGVGLSDFSYAAAAGVASTPISIVLDTLPSLISILTISPKQILANATLFPLWETDHIRSCKLQWLVIWKARTIMTYGTLKSEKKEKKGTTKNGRAWC